MKKIPTLFQRDEKFMVEDKITNGCEWVQKNLGVPTQKLDGTCCLIKDGIFYKRREVKKDKKPPEGFVLEETIKGKSFGWIPVDPNDSENKWHLKALELWKGSLDDNTYELVGPKIQGNPEKYNEHVLIPHGDIILKDCQDLSYEGLKLYLYEKDIEGIVWWQSDGRKAKLKKKDFGFKR